MVLRYVVLFGMILLSRNALCEKEFTVSYPQEEWEHIGEERGYTADLIIFKDGSKKWGFVEVIPELDFFFGPVTFEPKSVAGIAVMESGRIQVVTRQGYQFIGPGKGDEVTVRVSERKFIGGVPRPVQKSVETYGLNEINAVLFRKRAGDFWRDKGDFHRIILTNGVTFPAELTDPTIRISDGWIDREINPRSIVDVQFRGGLRGYLRGEALDTRLPFSYVKDAELSFRIPASERQFKLNWEEVDSISNGQGEFFVRTPFLFSKVVPERMVYIPSGRFIIGPAKKRPGAAMAAMIQTKKRSQRAQNFAPTKGEPSVLVEMAAFFIDRTEVTNQQYAQFVKETGHQPPPHWKRGAFVPRLANHPVVNVRYRDALAYARWEGKEIPTEMQWERAAKGGSGHQYPYGPRYRRLLSNITGSSTKPVGSYASVVAAKGHDLRTFAKAVHDMSGNAAEWTASSFHHDPYWEIVRDAEVPLQAMPPSFRAVRGGSFRSSPETATTTYRAAVHETDFNGSLGFRCVRNVER